MHVNEERYLYVAVQCPKCTQLFCQVNKTEPALTRPAYKNPNTVWKLKYPGKLFVAEVTLGPGFYLQAELPLLLRGGTLSCPCCGP